jgi:hypothetical protein
MKSRIVYIVWLVAAALLLTTGAVWALARATAVAPSATLTIPYPDQRDAASAAVHWLVTTHQNDDGGYSNFSGGANLAPSGVGGTMDAIQAIAATGHNPAANYPGKSANPVAYLQNNPDDVADYAATGGGPTGKVILGLTAVNQDPRDFMGYNFVISLTAQLSPTGQYNAVTPFEQSLALLALTAVHETAPLSATQWLKDQQAANGSWNDGYGTDDNADATGMAIMALLAQGEPLTSTTLISATQFLADAQLATGGWEYGAGYGENANSTALALQALSALGEDFYTVGGAWDKDGNTPLMALLGYQNSTGAFQSDFGSGPFDDFFATTQALPGASGRPYPLPARYEAARQAIACLADLQDPDTGAWEQFAGFGINAAGTARAIEAIAAFGDDPQSATWTPGSVNAVAALENLTPAYLAAGRGGRVGTVMQGVVAAGAPYTVTDFATFNLPLLVSSYLSPTGEYDNTAFGPLSHNEAMLGLITAGYAPDPTAVAWLQSAAINGSWGGADSDGASLNVLGRLNAAVPTGAFSNLRQTQQADGGWGFGGPASPNSTSEVVQGLVQTGDNPFAPAWSVVVNGRLQNPADPIMQQQESDGCWPNLYGPGADPYATTDAILLLMADPNWAERPSYLEYWTLLPLVVKE